ncbi:MAG: hypothetical protein K6T83_06320 [Alicyclobacillus sp.]|nr:hypothetical protein [Alicyclobacillus sp.]
MSRLVLVQVHEGQVTEFLAGDDLVGAMFDPNGNCIIVTRLRRIEIYSYPDLQLEHVIQLPERTYVLQALTGPS